MRKTLKCIYYIHHCVRECMPVNVPSKCTSICVISLVLKDNKGAMTFHHFPAIFPAILVKRHCTLLAMEGNNHLHLLGTMTGMHSCTQWCITNEKSLIPFWPVRPAALDFQARPAGHPAYCHLYS